MRMLTNLRARLRGFLKDKRGNIAMTLVLAAVPLTMAMGAGVDYARGLAVHSSMTDALDAAALAVGALFRSRDYQNDETEMVVLASVYLVQPGKESDYAAPTDGFVTPSDPETMLLGRLNSVYNKSESPMTPQAAAPVGFVVR